MAALQPESSPSPVRLPHHRTAAAEAPAQIAPAVRRCSCCPARLTGALLPGGRPAAQQAGSQTNRPHRCLSAARQVRCQPLLQAGSPQQRPDPRQRASSLQAPAACLAQPARPGLHQVGGNWRTRGDAAARRQQRRQGRRAGWPRRARHTQPAATQVSASTLSSAGAVAAFQARS